MSKTLLFGGNPPIVSEQALKIIDEFVTGHHVRIFVYTVWRPNWKPYMVKYIRPIEALGIGVTADYILGDAQNQSLFDDVADGDIVIFGGGDTVAYFEQFATEANRRTIKKLQNKNILFIGFSAGALLLGKVGYVSPLDNVSGQSILKDGLGLYDNLIISVHHDLWQDSLNFCTATESLTMTKLGINNAGFVFKDGDRLLLNDTVLYN